MRNTVSIVLLMLVAACTPCFAEGIVLENARIRAVLGEDGVWQELVDKATGDDYCAASRPVSFAAARIGGKTHSAGSARLDGDRLTIGLGGCETRLIYEVSTTDDWIAFRLVKIAGPRPTSMTLVRLRVTPTERVGRRLNAAWNDRYAICLMGTSRGTDGRPATGNGFTELAALSQDAPGPKLEGSGAAILAAEPKELRAMLRRFAAAYALPRNEGDGVPSKELPIARQSYWFLSFAEADVDRVVELCRQTGFRQVMLMSGAWCTSPGHYTFNTGRYPDGVESLRRTVVRLHGQGILVGMHCFASKVFKGDPYVTPVPDRRFWVDMSATLAGDVEADDASIRTATDLSQWPGSPVCSRKTWEGGVKKHQEAVIDDEIVQYESIGPEGKWNTFLGCRRGAWGTKAAPHKAGTPCRHYGVDGCINGYIIDQETTLLDETTSRLAGISNTCDFDMVYFDGGEDVDRRRFSYYSSNFQAVAMSKFRKRPIIHMGTVFTHQLWHSFTRSGTVDTYLSTLHGRIIAGAKIDEWPTVRDHIDRSVRYMQSVHDDMIPGELGWFGIWPKGQNTDGLQLDEIEYLMVKSLAYDAPISLETSFRQMDSHPLTPGILEIVGAYERLRLSDIVPGAIRKQLEGQGKDFVMFRPEPGDVGSVPAFVPLERLEGIADTEDLRGFVGPYRDGSVATAWHYLGKEGKLTLATSAVVALDIHGNRLRTEKDGEAIIVPIGNRRTTLYFPSLRPDAVRRLLANARFEARKPVVLWLQAEDYAAQAGEMVKSSEAGIQEPGAFGDVVLCSGPIDRTGKTPCYAEYRVDVPREGRWTLWARVRYPTGGDMSFGIVPAGEEVTLSGNQVLGNCGRNEKKWHWTGRGGGVTTVPPGSPITLKLPAGRFVFRIHPREGPGTAAGNPRLDCLCLAEDATYVPSDEDAEAALRPR